MPFSAVSKMNIRASRRNVRALATASDAGRSFLLAAILLFLLGSSLSWAGTWTNGTGLFSNVTLGALQNSSVINRAWPQVVNYDLNLTTWPYDVYVPPSYDGTKPYGVMVYITSDPSTGIVLQTTSNDKNIIWIAPRNVGNSANSTDRYGAALLAIYRAKELFNIDPRRVYLSGKSGGARTASGLAFYHSEVVHGVAPSSGFALPRLNEVTPDYIPNTSGQSDSYFDYSDQPFLYYYLTNSAVHNSIEAAGKTNKLRSYIITRYDDYREDYFVEGFHCAFEPQGQTCFLYDGPGTHTDASDAEMEEAINYLDRDDIFPVNANITAGAGGFSGMTNISQSGASAVEATSGGNTTYTLTPALTAVAAAKTASTFYWDNVNGSTVRWLWEVKNAAPTNQKTSFGLWFANETWGGGVPTSVTAGSNPGILITITQNGAQNRMIISARPDSGGETVFYDGNFSFVPAYSTAWTSTQTGYLSGTGSPVEIRLDLNKSRWQLTFNGIVLDGTTNAIASGTQISRDNKRMIFGYWDSALGTAFWTHGATYSTYNTWSPFTKSIFTAATGALSGTGTTPSPMALRYVIASDPNLPNPPGASPTSLTATVNGSAINLSWNALAGATSYEVKRATASGGPYTTLQSGYLGTSYSDPSAVAGTIYYYTVSANTASGSTLNAPEASAGINPPALTWIGAGADGNWQTTANWTTMPVAGDTLKFAGGRLTATNNFAAGTSFTALVFPAGASAFAIGGNPITLTGGVTNSSSNAQTINLALALPSGSHSVTTNAGGDVSLTGVLSGSGSLTKVGTGTATLSAINTYSGDTTVSAGTLVLGAGGGSGAIQGMVTINSGATLKATATDALGYNSGAQVSTLNVAGVLDNGVNGNEGYRTNIILTGGTMTSSGGGGFNFTVGYGITSAASATTSTISGGVVLRDNNNMTVDVADGAAATDLLVSGVISGSGGAITKTGAGTMTLTGSNSFTAGLTANAGTITVGNGNALGTGPATLNGVTLNNIGSSLTIGNAIAIGANGATIALSSGAGNLTLAGAISGAGNLTIAPPGGPLNSIYLNFPANTMTGTITIANSSGNNQTVTRINSANAGSATAAWVIGGAQDRGTSLEFGTGTIVFGSLSGSGLIVGNSGTQTIAVGALGSSTTFSGKIQNGSGTVALTKTGSGMLTLSGTNSYTGPTAINAGTLNITGALSGASAVTVNNGSALSGIGSMAGAVTVNSGGAIAPGNGGAGGAGTLTLSGGLTLGNGAVLNLDLAGTTTSDKLAVSGTFSASGTTTINITALGSFAGSGTYLLITGASGISAGNFALGTVPAGYVCTLGASSGNLSLTVMTQQESWRLANFGTTANSGNAADGADPDGDGMTNAQEFAAGTDPNSAASVLRVSQIQPGGNDIVVSFPSVLGKTYRLEYSDTLQSGSWVTLQNNIAGTGNPISVTDVGGAGQARRFYRIVLIP